MITTASTEPMYRRTAKDGDEVDAFSREARRHLCALQRAGVVHRTKTRAARRTRRDTRQALRVSAAGHQAMVRYLSTGGVDFTTLAEDYDRLVSL